MNRKALLMMVCVCFAFAKAYSQQPVEQDSIAQDSINEMVKPMKKSPVEAVRDFFDAFHAQDSVALDQSMADNLMLFSYVKSRSKGNSMEKASKSDFMNSILNIPENMTFKETLIEISHTTFEDIATVHTTYEFHVNGQFSHSGVNVFTMVYYNDKWLITGITDTRNMLY